ncbi:beta-galactosidase GalB [Lutibacter flavus]|uniref:Beta-galactosidase n=1 Tax=Lutibacter flavus TaxID=691689 RepID=A0A238VA96_9FLAO|nr:beta-galactosidase GalB [Lutibacter flavus]SNR31111.1 beta-galactosidase [Lutibacter flavus]
MKAKLLWYFLILILTFGCNKSQETRTVENFNSNWLFSLEAKKDSSYLEQTDAVWCQLNLPHDWSIEGDFNENHPATYNGGALPGGIGWYKKTFKVEEIDKLKEFYIDFDGVYMNSEVWINDHYLGKRPNGYIGFRYNLTPYLNFGEKENEIKVKVDNSQQPNSRWYSGSGIYRNVWLVKTDKLHINNWGTYVTTPIVTVDSATVNIETSIVNNYNETKNIVLKTTVLFNNEKITENSNHLNITTKNELTFSEELKINSPKLWSVENPQLYTALSEVYIDNQLVDTYKTPFGIRTFKFDLYKGFLLNNKSVKIKGVCNHHDLGALGTAINTRALERQLEILKEMGVNGIRTAHNPPAPELLDLCDKMGFIVMDESFDVWNNAKAKYDYAITWKEWHKKDLEDFIKRDRNHPSVFIWSIGNEIQEQWNEQGVETAKELKAIVRNLDTTRLITAGMNPPVNMDNQDVTIQFDKANVNYNALAASGVLDLIGYNYAHKTFEYHPQNFPNTPFIATETTSGLQTRGYYDQKSDTLKRWPVRWDIAFTGGNPDNTVSSYDQVSTPWGSTHEETWKVIKKHDYLSGMFIWTGFDYLGEPTPYVWPSRSSYFGVIDLAGFPKDVYYMYQSEWTDKPVLHVFPHWNWKVGNDVDIWAYYSQADEVELFLNNESLGIKKKEGDELHVMWRVPFKKGVLKAISRKDGKVVLVKEIKTAEEASQISLNADRNTIKPDGVDLSFITVSVLDKNGTMVPNAMNNIEFTIDGPGKIVGVDNGDPTSHASFKASNRNAFYGKCLVIVQSLNSDGIIKLSANSQGLEESSINISLNNN